MTVQYLNCELCGTMTKKGELKNIYAFGLAFISLCGRCHWLIGSLERDRQRHLTGFEEASNYFGE